MTTTPTGKLELTFEQQEEISELLEGYKNNPSNSNKFRYNLFAYIDEVMQQAIIKAMNEATIKELEALRKDLLRRTEIPSDAKFPTRDLVVITGEVCADLVQERIKALKRLGES